MITRTRAVLTIALIVVSSTALMAPAPATAATVTADRLPTMLVVDDSAPPLPYERARFDHWIDADGDGCNTRYEVLILQSTTDTTRSAGCRLSGGTWRSPYDGFVAQDTSQIEIDHVVALSEAWRSGAWAWNDSQRRAFANDLGVPYALTVSSSSANQSKSDKDPARWLPPLSSYTCDYVINWALVKYRWTLTVDSSERAAIDNVLSGDCGARAVTLPPVVGPGASAGEAPGLGAPVDRVRRLAGNSRYETALAVSALYQPGVPAVFLATGTDFPDALAAAAAAAATGGPLLLTPRDSLPSAVRSEIARLSPERIVVVGGEGAVSRQVMESVSSIAPTRRIGGASRYDTARMIVADVFDKSEIAFIATGRAFPDALAATGAAGKNGAPVVLVDGKATTVPAATVQLLRNKGTEVIVVAGESGAVSASIVRQLTNAGFPVYRAGGANRYETAAAINDAFFEPGTSDTAFLATGANFPDALAGAALAGVLGAPMFVTQTTCVPDVIRTSMHRLGPSTLAVLGGTSAVDANAARNLGCLSSSRPTISGTPRIGQTLTALPGSWTTGVSFSYRWFADGQAISGATSSTLALRDAHYGKRITVTVSAKRAGYVDAAATSSPTGTVARSSRTAPIDEWNCPSWAPIKGNASSMIYHVPGGSFYSRTKPEDCFTTEAAAQAAGYRKSRS